MLSTMFLITLRVCNHNISLFIAVGVLECQIRSESRDCYLNELTISQNPFVGIFVTLSLILLLMYNT